MEFRILGPLEVVADGRLFDLGGTCARAVLANLILKANEAVSADVLVDRVWGEAPPPTAGKAGTAEEAPDYVAGASFNRVVRVPVELVRP